jgi:hypothetical protein
MGQKRKDLTSVIRSALIIAFMEFLIRRSRSGESSEIDQVRTLDPGVCIPLLGGCIDALGRATTTAGEQLGLCDAEW